MRELCRFCGADHKTINHIGDNVTHSAREERRMTQEERDAMWDALKKSTKMISNGRLIDIIPE